MKKIHSYIWGSIKGLLKRLENLAREHKINTMNINGEKVFFIEIFVFCYKLIVLVKSLVIRISE